MFDEDEHPAHSNPNSSRRSTTAGAASGPRPRMLVADFCSGGVKSRSMISPPGAAAAGVGQDLRLLGLQASGQRRIAGEVDPFLDRDHRRQRQPVDLEAGSGLAAGGDCSIADLEAFDSADDRTTKCVGHPYPDLIAAGVGRLVPEQDQVEGTIAFDFGDACGEGGSGRLRVPVRSVGGQEHGLVGTDRHGITQLLLGVGRDRGSSPSPCRRASP